MNLEEYFKFFLTQGLLIYEVRKTTITFKEVLPPIANGFKCTIRRQLWFDKSITFSSYIWLLTLQRQECDPKQEEVGKGKTAYYQGSHG